MGVLLLLRGLGMGLGERLEEGGVRIRGDGGVIGLVSLSGMRGAKFLSK